ncbi:S8 family peptidase [Bacillus sp. REN16]|uniref:S8 family peptidase n=1 Tax=Bacillus sp. REN16 TaxID=2887296 RepID=UPI001E6105E3|nr:S8 family peptidase [Bacillus sp. REN16]MCC3355812.1 S8 family peptidase [Bacillus sp. REN16]
MWNKKRAAILALVITIGITLFVSLSFFTNEDKASPKSFSSPNSPLQIGNESIDTSPQIMNVDSIKLYNNVQKKLDKHEEIDVIDHNGKDKSHYHHHQVIVDFKNHLTQAEIKQIEKDIEGKLLRKLDSSYIFESDNLKTPEMISYFEKNKNVEFAEPNYLLMQNQQHPNDLLYNDFQWNLRMIDSENGWGITQGSDKVKIAIVDTGVDLDHPDLVNRITDGYNILKDNNVPDDDNGHGTHVAGIIASQTNNYEGTAGITWFNPIMPVKVMGSDGYGSTFDIARGIIWATDHGADVINLSLGNYQGSKMLKQAVDYAYRHDVVMVAASGNDNSSQPSFPSAYPQVLSVAAVDLNGDKADFSNYGDYIDVSAPGVTIPSTYIDEQYAALSGTSMAAPHVAALAGLMRSINPNLSNKDIMDIIKRTSLDLGKTGKDIYFGEGLIDIVQALNQAKQGTASK